MKLTSKARWVILGLVAGFCLAAVCLLRPVGFDQPRIALWIQRIPGEIDHIGCGSCPTPAIDGLIAAGPRAVPQLVKQLDSPNPRMVEGVIYILSEIGPPARAAAPALQRYARQTATAPDTQAGSAFAALMVITPTDSSLIQLAEQLATQGVDYGLAYICQQGPVAQPIVRRLLVVLPGPPIGLLQAFVDNGGPLTELEDYLISGLGDEDGGELYYWARDTLLGNPDQLAVLVDKWRAKLDAGDRNWRLFVLDNLWRAGPAALPDIKYWLNHGDRDEVVKAVSSCYRLEDDAAPLIEELLLVSERDDSLGPNVASVLGRLGAPGLAALQDLAVTARSNTSLSAMRELSQLTHELGPSSVELMWEMLLTTKKAARMEAYYFFLNNAEYGQVIEKLLPRFEDLLAGDDEFLADLAFAVICRRRYAHPGELSEAEVRAMYEQAAHDRNPRVGERAAALLAQ
ncbi:hypothetical protein JW859_07990 [bacterium]|nr:hypothetical protein [bacterium]